jgi:hypothetical protein
MHHKYSGNGTGLQEPLCERLELALEARRFGQG